MSDKDRPLSKETTNETVSLDPAVIFTFFGDQCTFFPFANVLDTNKRPSRQKSRKIVNETLFLPTVVMVLLFHDSLLLNSNCFTKPSYGLH